MSQHEVERVLLKVSGESLKAVGSPRPYDRGRITAMGAEIRNALARSPGTELCIMPGGGNLGRGDELIREYGFRDRTAHAHGMLHTVENALVLRDILSLALREMNIGVRVMTAIQMDQITEPYLPEKAIHHLLNSRVVIFAGGSGRTHCSTDWASANRAKEIECDLLLKGTKEDGVYDADPRTNPKAKLITRMTPREFAERDLRKIFDPDGIAYARENKLPIRIFNIFEEGNLARAIAGEDVGTYIANE